MVASVVHLLLQRVHLKFSACTTLYSNRDSVPIPVFPVEDMSKVMVNVSKMKHKSYELPKILILLITINLKARTFSVLITKIHYSF